MTASLTFRLTSTRLALLTLCAILAGCASLTSLDTLKSLKTYVPEVVQGNFVSSEQSKALRLGMSRAEVRDILGTPLVTSLFHANRWDYAFSIQRQGVPPQHYQLTVTFKDNVLSKVDSSDLPSESEFAQQLVAPRKKAPMPNLQATEAELEKFSVKKPLPAPAPSAPLPTRYPPLEAAPL